MPKGCFTAAKIFTERDRRLRNHFAADGRFRSGYLGAAKFRRPCFFLVFELLLIPSFLLSPFFDIPPDFDHPKTYVTSKQIKIKALKSKLKQVINKTKRYGLASL